MHCCVDGVCGGCCHAKPIGRAPIKKACQQHPHCVVASRMCHPQDLLWHAQHNLTDILELTTQPVPDPEPICHVTPMQILAMATRRHTWTVAEAWSAWREFVRQCKHKALSLAMAVTHHSRSVTYRAFWAWSRAAELAAVARAQAQGILEFQRLLQVRSCRTSG
jgi:hypothetical protein